MGRNFQNSARSKWGRNFGAKGHIQVGWCFGPLITSSGSCLALKSYCTRLWAEAPSQWVGERALRLFPKGPVVAIPATPEGIEGWGGNLSPAPRLAITEPKLSSARGIVVLMSFQHKINCPAHQPAGGHHLLAAPTSSQKETTQMWRQVSQLQPALGVTLQAHGERFCHARMQYMPERAQLQPGTSDGPARLVSYLSSSNREQDKQFRERQGNHAIDVGSVILIRVHVPVCLCVCEPLTWRSSVPITSCLGCFNNL